MLKKIILTILICFLSINISGCKGPGTILNKDKLKNLEDGYVCEYRKGKNAKYEMELVDVDFEFDKQMSRIDLLRRALDGLPPPDRALLHLVYFEDMPVGEAAEILHTNRMALSMRLMRLRKRLASSICNLNSSSAS